MLSGVEVPKEQILKTAPDKHQVRPIKTPPGFDKAAYLKANPDLIQANVDPVAHWLEFGYREERPLR